MVHRDAAPQIDGLKMGAMPSEELRAPMSTHRSGSCPTGTARRRARGSREARKCAGESPVPLCTHPRSSAQPEPRKRGDFSSLNPPEEVNGGERHLRRARIWMRMRCGCRTSWQSGRLGATTRPKKAISIILISL